MKRNSGASLVGLSLLILAMVFVLGAPLGSMGQDEEGFEDFAELELYDLLDVKIVSASKNEQSIMESPNAITVITAEDIERSGYRTIPEALKLVPGVYVARISGNRWSVTIGGFAHGKWTNNLLVLVDGVSLYSGSNGGVAWEDLPVGIDEIKKIEVIRGPGGVLYGANAVNGVISIITWRYDDDAPSYAKTRVGTQGVRAGNAAATLASEDGNLSTRLAISYDEDNGQGAKDGQKDYDAAQSYTVMSTTSMNLSESLRLTLAASYREADLDYRVHIGDNFAQRRSRQSVLRLRLEQSMADGGHWYFQAYNWRHDTDQRLPLEGETEFRPEVGNIVDDLEFQHMIPFEALGNHNFSYGGGFRWVDVYDADIRNESRKYTVANAYMHDEWALSDQLLLYVGGKWEHVDLVEPTWHWRASMVYMPAEEHSFRFSAANAWRSPIVLEEYMNAAIFPLPVIPGVLPPAGWPLPWSIATVYGNDELDPEQVVSYEFGYRGVFSENLAIEISYAYREYDDLIALVKTNPGIFVPGLGTTENAGQIYTWLNQGSATSNAVEVGVDARVTDEIRLLLHYAHLEMNTNEDSAENRDTNVPRNMGRVQLSYTSPTDFQFDISGAYTDEVEVVFVNDPNIIHEVDDYWRLDIRVAQGFKMSNGYLTIGAVGTNLNDEWHEEYASFAHELAPQDVRKAYYGFVEYEFE